MSTRKKTISAHFASQPFRLDLSVNDTDALIRHIRNNQALGYLTVPVVEFIPAKEKQAASYRLAWRAVRETI